MTKSIEARYKKLTDVEHVLLRPGRYLGSVKPHDAISWTVDEANGKMVKREVTWNPALLKMFDEVISNSVDESKRPGSKLDIIKVTVDQETGEISVWDNGGIPVVIHKEHNQYIPHMIFGELRSGSNFDDSEDSTGTGQNGEGSSLVNIFSTKFIVETCDGKKKFKQIFSENMHKHGEPKVATADDKSGFTKITFTPDYDRLACKLDDGNMSKLIKRVYDIAGCNPNLKVSLNGKRVQINTFKDYVKMYTEEFVFEENDEWKVAVASSADGFQHVSFVNTTETSIGGTHITYIVNQIVDELRAFIKKKHKVDVKPSDVRNHMTLFINATIINPRYSSQTKEDLITEPKDYKTSFKVSDKFIARLIKSPVIQDVLDWVAARERANEMAELRSMNKDLDKKNPKHVDKFIDATTKDRKEAILFLTEGDSASGGIKNARDSKIMGVFPMKGKPPNAYEKSIKELIGADKKDKKEDNTFVKIMTITGLQLGVPIKKIEDIRFGMIVIATDQDLDGISIRGLLISSFYKYWPELFDMGIIYVLNTPLAKVKYKKSTLEFYSMPELDVWRAEHEGESYHTKYYKGLGTSTDTEWEDYLAPEKLTNNLVKITAETAQDSEMLRLLFSKEQGMTDKRKEWLNIAE